MTYGTTVVYSCAGYATLSGSTSAVCGTQTAGVLTNSLPTCTGAGQAGASEGGEDRGDRGEEAGMVPEMARRAGPLWNRAVGITWTTFAVNDGSQNFFNGWSTGLNSVGAANYILPCANFASYVSAQLWRWL